MGQMTSECLRMVKMIQTVSCPIKKADVFFPDSEYDEITGHEPNRRFMKNADSALKPIIGKNILDI